MAIIAETLDHTTIDAFADSSKALVESMKADTTKQYVLDFAKATLNRELDSLRIVARNEGYSFTKVRNSQETDLPDGVSVRIPFYLAPLRPSGKLENRPTKGAKGASSNAPASA